MKDAGPVADCSTGKTYQESVRYKVDRNKVDDAVAVARKIRDLTFTVSQQDWGTCMESFNPPRLRLSKAALDDGGTYNNDRNTVTALCQQLFSHRLSKGVSIKPTKM